MFTLQNSHLTLSVSPLGAQMQSLRSADGVEYLWVGDSAYWGKHAPNLFPFIGRLFGDGCRVYGETYPMPRHGFANVSTFAPIEQTETTLFLSLSETKDTLAKYPFRFTFRVGYALEDNRLSITYQVENRDAKTMPFAVGGHPGFNVPLLPDERFEDYFLEFSQPCRPDRIGFSPAVYVSGCDTPYPLPDEKTIPLRHDLFDDDAIILKNMARAVTLRSRVSSRGVTVSYPDMGYLGLWHTPKTDAPFLCIEPWTSLPARQDVVEELTCKSDMPQLAPGKTFSTTWTITAF